MPHTLIISLWVSKNFTMVSLTQIHQLTFDIADISHIRFKIGATYYVSGSARKLPSVKKSYILKRVYMALHKQVKCYKRRTAWCWNLDSSESIPEITRTFWNVALENDGEDQLDRTCEKWRITKPQGGAEQSIYNKTKEDQLYWSHVT